MRKTFLLYLRIYGLLNKFLKTKRFYSSAQSKTFISENHTYDLDVSKNLVVGFNFLPRLAVSLDTKWAQPGAVKLELVQ